MEASAALAGFICTEIFARKDAVRVEASLTRLFGTGPTRNSVTIVGMRGPVRQTPKRWELSESHKDSFFQAIIQRETPENWGVTIADLKAAVQNVQVELYEEATLPFCVIFLRVAIQVGDAENHLEHIHRISVPFRQTLGEWGGLTRRAILPKTACVTYEVVAAEPELHARLRKAVDSLSEVSGSRRDKVLQQALPPHLIGNRLHIGSVFPLATNEHVVVMMGHPFAVTDPLTLHILQISSTAPPETILLPSLLPIQSPLDVGWNGAGGLAFLHVALIGLDSLEQDLSSLQQRISFPTEAAEAAFLDPDVLDDLALQSAAFRVDFLKFRNMLSRPLTSFLEASQDRFEIPVSDPFVIQRYALGYASGLLSGISKEILGRLSHLEVLISESEQLISTLSSNASTRATRRSTRAVEVLTWVIALLTLAAVITAAIQLFQR